MAPKPAIRTAVRVAIGGILAATIVALGSVAVLVPWPEVEHAPAAAEVEPFPGDTVLTCVGSVRALGRDIVDATTITSAGAYSRTFATAGALPEVSALDTPNLLGDSPAELLRAVPEGRNSAMIAASESASMNEPDLFGLASAPCREAALESWLVGGSATTGASDVVILSNPADVTATLTLSLFPATGSPSTVVVPARTQVAVPLAAQAAGESAPVVKVTSQGAPVRVVLQSSLMRVLQPVGFDLQDSVRFATDDLTFAGVRILVASSDQPSTLLRLLSPDIDTPATATVWDTAGEIVQQYELPLTANQPAELGLVAPAGSPPIPAGEYTVTVTAQSPVVGAVRQETADRSDFAWMTPAPPITGEVLFAAPAGPGPRVHLVNGSDLPAAVEFGRVGDAPVMIELDPHAAYSQAVTEGDGYRVSSPDGVAAAVTLQGSGVLAGWPLWPGQGARPAVTVYP